RLRRPPPVSTGHPCRLLCLLARPGEGDAVMDGMTATTPFLEFRLWWRRASAGKQSAAAGALALAVALLVWIAVPLASGPSSTTLGAGSNGSRPLASGGQASLGAGSAAAGGAGSSTGAGPALAGGAGSSAGSSQATGGHGAGGTGGAGGSPGALLAAGCAGAPKNVSVGVVLINVANPNNVFGVPSPGGQQADWNAMFDSINKSGGAGCNHLVPDYQTYNDAAHSSAQNAC